MAMARSSRGTGNSLCRIAAACRSEIASAPALHRHTQLLSHASPLPPSAIRPFSTSAARSWRTFINPCTSPCGMGVIVQNSTPWGRAASLPSICVREYSKRPKKWQGVPHAFVQVEPGAPCPPYSPNAGSVKKRKHNKRMAQRQAFSKAQAHQRKEETKAALIKRDAARRKRWREGAARVQAWAKHLREQQITAVPV